MPDQPYPTNFTSRSGWPGSSRPLIVSRPRSGRLSVHWCTIASQATWWSHAGRHGEVTLPGPVHQQRPAAGRDVLQRFQRCLQRGGHPGVPAGGRQLLVGDQLGLEHHPERAIQRLDLVVDGTDRALGERDQPHRGDPDCPARR